MKKIIIFSIALQYVLTRGKTYYYSIEGQDKSQTPEIPAKGVIKFDYFTPLFQPVCKCSYVKISIFLNTEKFYFLDKMTVGGDNCCKLEPKNFGGYWKEKDASKSENLFFSFFSSKKSDPSHSSKTYSIFQFKQNIKRWGGENNNNLIQRYGITLPKIFSCDGDKIKEKHFSLLGLTFTWIVTIPVALLLIYLDFKIGEFVLYPKKGEDSPYFSALNSVLLNFVFVLIAKRFYNDNDNSLWIFWGFLFSSVYLLNGFISALKGAKERRSGNLVYVEVMYIISLLSVVIFQPFFTSYLTGLSAALTGFECMKVSKNKKLAKFLGFLNFSKGFFIWIYLSTEFSPADLTVNYMLGYIPLGILGVSMVLMLMFFNSKGSYGSANENHQFADGLVNDQSFASIGNGDDDEDGYNKVY